MIAHGSGLVPGKLSALQLFRAEADGLLHATYATHLAHQQLSAICEWEYDTDIPIMDFYCDNEAVIKRMRRWMQYDKIYPSIPLTSDFDLTYGTIHYVHENEMKLKFTHVKGHQDKNKTDEQLSKLPIPSHKNCKCNWACTNKLTHAEPIN